MTSVEDEVTLDTPVAEPDLPPGRFSDRELSWLAFNNRVLDLAKDAQRVPLLERARFLAIFCSNLDEFFMVRVAGLKRRLAAGVAVPSSSGLMPRELHDAILGRTRELVADATRVFAEDVRPAAGRPRHRDPALGRAHRRRTRPDAPSFSRNGSSRCSPRSPSTRRTRSPTSPGSA